MHRRKILAYSNEFSYIVGDMEKLRQMRFKYQLLCLQVKVSDLQIGVWYRIPPIDLGYTDEPWAKNLCWIYLQKKPYEHGRVRVNICGVDEGCMPWLYSFEQPDKCMNGWNTYLDSLPLESYSRYPKSVQILEIRK
jgi:hypothetical protein